MDLREVMAIARVLADSREFGFATPPQALAARILAGLEIGVPPLVSVSNIGFQNGKLTVSASLQASLLNRSERWDVELLECTKDVCRLAFHDHLRGRTSEVSYHYEDAVKAKLPQKPSGKGQNPWLVYEPDMNFASALKRGVKRFASSLLLGHAAYSPGDLGEPGPADLVSDVDPLEAAQETQDETPEIGTAEEVVVEQPTAPGVLATADQVDALCQWQEYLEIHQDEWLEALGRRGVTEPGHLTEQQAADLLVALEHRAEQQGRIDGLQGRQQEELVSFPPELPASSLPTIEGAGYGGEIPF